MNRFKKCAFGAMLTLPLIYLGGCGNTPRIPAQLPLGGGLGSFDLTAGETSQKSGTGSIPDSSVNVGSGAILLDPDDITFTPASDSGSKGTTTFQNGGTFTITAGIAAVGDLDTVCTAPVDEYGAFTVTLDAEFNVTSISPSSINLEQSTIDLINSGQFSICLTVDDSTVSGTLTIAELSFLFGL